jgi:hypothetical protein
VCVRVCVWVCLLILLIMRSSNYQRLENACVVQNGIECVSVTKSSYNYIIVDISLPKK